MALGICTKCLKYLVFTINLLFWLFGMGVLAAAIYIRCYPDDVEKALGAIADDSLYTVTYIFMAIGGLMTVVGFLGCCGAYQESPCIIATFIMLIILILLGEIGGIVAAYILRDNIKQTMEDGFMEIISTRNLTDTKSRAFLWLQENLHCCGAKERHDWVCNTDLNAEGIANHNFNIKDWCESKDLGTDVMLEKREMETWLKVPQSCCTADGFETEKENCGNAAITNSDWIKRTYSKGCSNTVERIFADHLNAILGVIAGVIVLEILVLAGALVLCCSFRRQIEEDGYAKP